MLCGKLADGDFVQAWTIDIMELDGSGIDAHTINILVKAYKGKRCTTDVRTVDRALALLQRYSVMVGEVLVNAALEYALAFEMQDGSQPHSTSPRGVVGRYQSKGACTPSLFSSGLWP